MQTSICGRAVGIEYTWNDAVEARNCIDIDSKISLVEQYTTVDKYSIAGRFKLKVFVNCLQVGLCQSEGTVDKDLRVKTSCH